MKDTVRVTVMCIYDNQAILARVNSVDRYATEQYSAVELIVLKQGVSRTIHLLGQEIFLITEGRDEFGRLIGRYKWLQSMN